MVRKHTSPYRRLPGGRLTRHSLWQSDDHLLSVQRREFTERYVWFYFRDIQAIMVQRTSTYAILTAIVLSLTVLTALLAITRENGGVMVFWWIMTAAFGSVALWNWQLGPTCICYLFTAIDRYRVRALSRIKIADRVIGTLQPLIQRAQRDIDIQAPPTSEQSDEQGMYLRPTSVTHARSVESPPALHYHGAIHIAAFVLLLLNGLFLSGVLLFFGALSVGGYAATLPALGVCMIIALVKQAGSDMPKSIQGLVWAQLGYIIVSLMIGLAFVLVAFYTYMRDFGGELINGESTIATAVEHFSPVDFPMFIGFYVILIAIALLIGGLGLMFLRRFRQAYRQGVTPQKI